MAWCVDDVAAYGAAPLSNVALDRVIVSLLNLRECQPDDVMYVTQMVIFKRAAEPAIQCGYLVQPFWFGFQK